MTDANPPPIRFTPAVAATVARMGAQMPDSPKPAEVVRRALILLDFKLSLNDDEELVVLNNASGRFDRLRLVWEGA